MIRSIVNNFLFKIKNNKEFQIVFTFNVVISIGSLLAYKVVAKSINPLDLGEFLLFMNIASWLSLPVSGLYNYNLYFWPEFRQKNIVKKFKSFTHMFIKAYTIYLCILTLVIFKFQAFNISTLLLAGSLFIVSLSQGFLLFFAPFLHLERNRILAGFQDLLNSNLARYATIVILVTLLSNSSSSHLLYYQAIHSVFIIIFCLTISYKIFEKYILVEKKMEVGKVNFSDDKKNFIIFTIPFIVSAFFIQVVSSAERWGFAFSNAKESVSFFALAQGIALAASGAIAAVFNNYFIPFISDAAAQYSLNKDSVTNLRIIFKKYFLISFFFQFLLSLILIFFSAIFVEVFFSEKYLSIQHILPYIGFGILLGSVADVGSFLLVTLRKSLFSNGSKIIASVLQTSIILSLLYLNMISLKTMSWAFLVSQLSYLVLVFSIILFKTSFFR